jgi:hypothetical protein
VARNTNNRFPKSCRLISAPPWIRFEISDFCDLFVLHLVVFRIYLAMLSCVIGGVWVSVRTASLRV